jgi:hypothetical protein
MNKDIYWASYAIQATIEGPLTELEGKGLSVPQNFSIQKVVTQFNLGCNLYFILEICGCDACIT